MALNDLLVHVDNTQACEKRLHAAIRVAQSHAAHLTGLYVMPPVVDYIMYPVAPISQHVREQIQQPLRQSRDTARALFDAATSRAELAAEWRDAEGDVTMALTVSARYADLVILGQYHPDDPADTSQGVVDRMVLGSGRPCLVIPYIGAQATIGQRVLVAWNAGREGVRAVNDALPLLQGAASVVVLAVNPPSGEAGEGAIPSADLCHHLARHDVTAEARSTRATDIDVGDLLLSYGQTWALT